MSCQPFRTSFNRHAITFYQEGGVLFLEEQEPQHFNHPLTLAVVILRDYIQQVLEMKIQMDGHEGDFLIDDWEMFPAEATPIGIAMYGFRFGVSGQNFRLTNNFEAAARHARFCAWEGKLTGYNWDYYIVSRYSFTLERIEYDVVPVDDLRKHEFWIRGSGDPKVLATFLGA